MGVRILKIITCIFLIFVISQPLSFSDIHTCKCEFDTNEYEATGYFAGTCSYTMNETRRKCEIRRAEDYQDIRKSLIRYDKFGDPSELRLEILPITTEFFYNPHTLIELNPIHFFSFMMRSSYLAAPFLSDEERGIIDNLLLNMLKKHGYDMLLIFAGFYAENTFKEESTTMYVNKGTARLTVNIHGNNILICTKVLPSIQE